MEIIRYVSYIQFSDFKNHDITLKDLLNTMCADREDKTMAMKVTIKVDENE